MSKRITCNEELLLCQAYLHAIGNLDRESKLVFVYLNCQVAKEYASNLRGWTIEEVNARNGKIRSWNLVDCKSTKHKALDKFRYLYCNNRSFEEIALYDVIRNG